MAMGDIVARGGIPYRDVLDRKPPGVFWMFAAIGKLFGPWNIHAVHALAFVATLLLCLAAARVCARLTPGRRAGPWAAVLFALYSACFTREIISFNAEYPMLLACAAALLCLTSSQPGEHVGRSVILACLSGVFGGLATVFKQYGIVVYLPMALLWLLPHFRADRATGRSPWQRLALSTTAGMLGLVIVFAGVVWWFSAVGALRSFCNWAILDGFHYARAGWGASRLRVESVLTFVGLAVAWFPLWLGLSRAGPWRSLPSFFVVLAGTAGAAATTLLSGRSFAHYYLPLAWFSSVLAVPGLQALWRGHRHRLVLVTAATLPLLFFAVFNTARDVFWPDAKFNRAHQAQLSSAATWIRKHVAPDETIAVWGTASQLYVMSRRSSGTRYVFADFISGRQPGFDSGVAKPMPGALSDYLADLERSQPVVFVDTAPAALNDYGHFPISSIAPLQRYLSARYCLAATIQDIRLWGRAGGGRFCRN